MMTRAVAVIFSFALFITAGCGSRKLDVAPETTTGGSTPTPETLAAPQTAPAVIPASCEIRFAPVVEGKVPRGTIFFRGQILSAAFLSENPRINLGKIEPIQPEVPFQIDARANRAYRVEFTYAENGQTKQGFCPGVLQVPNPDNRCHNPTDPRPCIGTFRLALIQVATPPTSSELSLSLVRACSQQGHGRKQIPNDKTLFSAKFPILSAEVLMKSGGKNAWVTVDVMDLARETLLKSRPKIPVPTLLGKIEQKLGTANWKNGFVRFQVCDDAPNARGVRAKRCLGKPLGDILSFNGLVAGTSNLSYVPVVYPVEKLLKKQIRGLAVISSLGFSADKRNSKLCDSYTPLVLHFADRPMITTGPLQSGVSFDIDDEGGLVSLGWLHDPASAFLVYDHDGSGDIENGGELFGSATRRLNEDGEFERVGAGYWDNGFAALAQLDSNANGYFDPGDADWSRVELWFDTGHDGRVSHAGELVSLDQRGVRWIDLRYDDIAVWDSYGNEIRQQSLFSVIENGAEAFRPIVDIWFRGM